MRWGCDHRDRMVALVQADTAAAVQPLPQGFEQCLVQAVELVSQRLQHPLGFLGAAGRNWACALGRRCVIGGRGFLAPGGARLFGVPDLGRADDFREDLGQALDDGGRQAGRGCRSGPDLELEVLESCFLQARVVGHERGAARRGHADRAQLPGLDLHLGEPRRKERQLQLATGQAGDHLWIALVGHVDGCDPGAGLEKFHAEVADRADAGRAIASGAVQMMLSGTRSLCGS